MVSLFTSLYTGASGLFTSQTGIQVTGNNISNVNTEGYSRQTANVSEANSLEQGSLIVGTGSTVSTILRAGDTFITKQLIERTASYGEYDASSSPLGDIEQILSIDDTSLSSDIDDFFDAWQSLSSNPNGSTERQQVLIQAEDLANHFQDIDQQLTDVVDSINNSIESEIPSLNDMLTQIAGLNQSILQTEAAGGDANTLRDQRELLVQNISEICGATSYVDDNGMTCLQLENGLPLVTGKTASSFSVERIDGLSQLTLVSGQSTFSLDGSDLGGSLKGYLDVRDETIPAIKDSIDRLAYELATAVNSLHTTGVDQNGNAGTDLFSLTAPTSSTANAWEGAAASIAVNFDDTALLCTGTTGLSGDNSLSLEIGALRDSAIIDGSTLTEEYARISAKVGLLVDTNNARLTAATDALNETLQDRDEIAGVSADEEMLMLIQYQSGYEAASNYLTVVKEMLDTLLTM